MNPENSKTRHAKTGEADARQNAERLQRELQEARAATSAEAANKAEEMEILNSVVGGQETVNLHPWTAIRNTTYLLQSLNFLIISWPLRL